MATAMSVQNSSVMTKLRVLVQMQGPCLVKVNIPRVFQVRNIPRDKYIFRNSCPCVISKIALRKISQKVQQRTCHGILFFVQLRSWACWITEKELGRSFLPEPLQNLSEQPFCRAAPADCICIVKVKDKNTTLRASKLIVLLNRSIKLLKWSGD